MIGLKKCNIELRIQAVHTKEQLKAKLAQARSQNCGPETLPQGLRAGVCLT